MKTKEKKLALVDELVVGLGLTRDEVVDYFTKLLPVKEPKKSRPKIDIMQVKVGMIWYEDDTFSFDILPKRSKAIVELVEYTTSTVFGDLTASELFEIKEVGLPWHETKMYIEKFSYPCQMDEKIVWYSIEQLKKVYMMYERVRRTFDIVYKQCRKEMHWSSTENSAYNAWALHFNYGGSYNFNKYNSYYVRPVLALKVS